MNVLYRRVVTLGVATLCAALAACTAVDAPATPDTAPTQTVSASPASPVDPWMYVEPSLVDRLKGCAANDTALTPDGLADLSTMTPCISKVVKVTIKGTTVSYQTKYNGLKFTKPWVTTITAEGYPTVEQVSFALSDPAKGDNFFVAVVRNRAIGNQKWSAFETISALNEVGSGSSIYQTDTETEVYICLSSDKAADNKPATNVAWKWAEILNLMQR